MDVNVKSVFLMIQRCLGALEASRGCIVNISSIASKRPIPHCLPFSVSKAALDSLTECCAVELSQKGIRVNSVNPSTVMTNMHSNAGMGAQGAASFYESSNGAHLLGRVGTVDDVSSMVMFLADKEQSGWVTGQTFVLDGGRLLGLHGLK